MTSHANLIGHSVLIPGALLLMGVKEKTERRALGWMAFGLSLHLGWEFLRHTAPMGVDAGTLPLLLWVGANVLVGLFIWIVGLEASKD